MSKPDPFKSGSTRNWSKPIWFYQDNRAPLLSVTPRNWHDLWKQLALPYTVAFWGLEPFDVRGSDGVLDLMHIPKINPWSSTLRI